MSEEQEIHPAVQLLLARMESNPETYVDGKQLHVIDRFRQFLTKHEKEILKVKEREINMNHLHKKLMEQVLTGKEQNK